MRARAAALATRRPPALVRRGAGALLAAVACLLAPGAARAGGVARVGAAAADEGAPPGGAAADEGGPGAPPASEVGPRRRALAVTASIVPGVLVHGAGHFVAGEPAAARRLLTLELVGLGMLGTGGALLIATGASRHYSAPSVGLVVSGIGLFGVSWLADIFGSAGGAGLGGEPDLARHPIDLELGYLYASEPQFDYSQFATAAARFELGAYRIEPSAAIALDADNQRLRLDAARRFLGAGSARPTGDGSRLELAGALTHHRYGDDDFSVTTGELALAGRLDLARLSRTTAGSFAELAVGLAGEVTDYKQAGAGADLGEMLLTRFAWGVYLGRPGGAAHGEASISYDHRRDTLAGGISPGEGPGSGFVGLFGASAILYLGPRWGVRAELEQGAAR